MQMLYRLSYVGAINRNAPGGRIYVNVSAASEITASDHHEMVGDAPKQRHSPLIGLRAAKAVEWRCKRRNLGSGAHPVNPKLQKTAMLRESHPIGHGGFDSAAGSAIRVENGAGNGIRTRDPQLGRLTLYH